MYLTTLAAEAALGQILSHNLADADGRKAFKKGHRVTAADLPRLQALGYSQLRVAVLEPGDVAEDAAAQRLSQALAGPGTTASKAVTGRVNLLAARRGLLTVDLEALRAVNLIDGLTVATLPRHRVVEPRTILATIKIIPYAIAEADLVRAERALPTAAIDVLELHPSCVGVILVGHPNAEQRVTGGVLPAIRSRIEELGATMLGQLYVAMDEDAVAQAVVTLRRQGARLLILAGETSIMDSHDVIPSGLVAAGGRIIHYGAPVEPGNLLLLAELPGLAGASPIPVIGAPGCVRSRDTNVVDLILPRLLAGQPLGKTEIVELGHGGLLV